MTTYKIARVDEIEVFINNRNEITIKQEDGMGEDDSIVSFPRTQVEALIGLLTKVAADFDTNPTADGIDERGSAHEPRGGERSN